MLYVGASGYFYKNWIGDFYPPELPLSKWLEYYVKFFNSIKLNSIFYKFPITHTSKLKNLEKLKEFLEIVLIIDDKLGVILFQLPPSLKYEKELFINFINALDKNLNYAIEFRNKSWYIDEVYDLMKANNICLVWHDFNQDFIFEYTANFNYVRFHGISGKYIGSYDNSAFKDAKRFIELKNNF
jgi:uncharacterized protein YecE (DUF72 family)